MQVKFKKLSLAAITPRYATDGAGAFDIAAARSGRVPSGGCASVATDLAFEISPGHVMLLFSRSGHGFKFGVRLTNCVGVIDSDYRGELRIGLHNDSRTAFHFDAGARLAQAIVVPLPAVELVETFELSDTARGTSGLGSTGS